MYVVKTELQNLSMKLKESVKNTKPEPRHHYQSPCTQSSLALLATDSLELKLA